MFNSDAYISHQFTELLEAHGYNAVRHGNAVSLYSGFPVFLGEYSPPGPDDIAGVYRLNVLLDEKSRLEEYIAAFGDDDREAINNAFHQFVTSLFHPVLSACGISANNEGAEHETWKCANHPSLEAWFGEATTRRSSENALELPEDLMNPVEQAVEQETLRDGYSWISLFCLKAGEHAPTGSVKLNNVEWPRGLDAFLSLDWPNAPGGFYSVRFFVLLRAGPY